MFIARPTSRFILFATSTGPGAKHKDVLSSSSWGIPRCSQARGYRVLPTASGSYPEYYGLENLVFRCPNQMPKSDLGLEHRLVTWALPWSNNLVQVDKVPHVSTHLIHVLPDLVRGAFFKNPHQLTPAHPPTCWEMSRFSAGFRAVCSLVVSSEFYCYSFNHMYLVTRRSTTLKWQVICKTVRCSWRHGATTRGNSSLDQWLKELSWGNYCNNSETKKKSRFSLVMFSFTILTKYIVQRIQSEHDPSISIWTFLFIMDSVIERMTCLE